MKKIWKTVVSVILILGCIAGIFSATAVQSKPESAQLYGATLPFRDVPSNAWYYNDVAIAVQSRWMKGTSTTTFKPNAEITNAEVLQIMSNLGIQDASDECPEYDDLPENSWYSTVAVKYGAYLPLHWDRHAGKARLLPNEPITRSEFAYTMLRCYAGFEDEDIVYYYKVYTGDYDASFGYHHIPEAALVLMNKLGIISGYVNGDLGEYDSLSRAQCAAILKRLNETFNNDQTEANPATEPTAQFHEVTNEITATALSIMANRIYQENEFASSINVQNKIFTRENWRVYEEDLLDSLVDRMCYNNMRSIGTYIGENADTGVEVYNVTQSDFEAWMNYYYGTDTATPPTAGLYQNGNYRAESSQEFIGDEIQITHVYSFSNGKYYVQFGKIQESEGFYNGSGYAVLYWTGDHYQVHELGWDTPQIPDERLAYHCSI